MTSAGSVTEPANDFGSVFPGWAQFSAVAVLVILMVIALRAGYAFAQGAYRREVKHSDDCQIKLDTLSQKVIDEYVPAIVESSRINAEVIVEVRRLRESYERLERQERQERRR